MPFTPQPAPKYLNPDHYKLGGIECIDVVEDWRLDFHLGNALKYLARAGRKSRGTRPADLRKAIWYIQRALKCGSSPRPGRIPVSSVCEQWGQYLPVARVQAITALAYNRLDDAIRFIAHELGGGR